MSLEPLRSDELAAVVTYLEMLRPPSNPDTDTLLTLVRVEDPDAERYRALFRRVGSTWLWFSRLTLNDDRLLEIIRHPDVELFTAVHNTEGECGMVELDFREAGQCELSFIGLVPELAGKGHGRWLLDEALRLAWRDGVKRVHVHTCSLDHPAALPAYERAGFTAYKRAVERFQDPRLNGILPLDCAPQVPVFGTPTSAGPRPAS